MSSDWGIAPLSDLTINFDGKRRPVKSPDRKSGPYPYYGASGIVDFVDDYIFDGEYLLIAEDGENLKTRQTPIAFMAEGKFWVNNHAHIVTGNEKANTRFLMYALQIADIDSFLTGAVMPKLTQGNLNKITVPCPPLEIQNGIVSMLGVLDDKIELNRKINQTFEQIAQAIFKSWFVDFDPVHAKMEGRQPKGMDTETAALFPDEFVESELDRIPKGWSLSHIGNEVDVLGGGTPSTKNEEFWMDGEFNWTTPKDLSGLPDKILLSTERKLTQKGISNISSGLLPVNTVLMSSRAPVGYLVLTKIPTAINQGFIAMKCNKRLSPEFVLQWATHSMDEIKQRSSGSTFAEISKTTFRPLPVIVPPDKVIDAYTKIASVLYEEISTLAKESENLARTRDTLLPRLLSGELKIEG